MIPEAERLVSVLLPKCIWLDIYTILTAELDMFPEGSQEYRNHKATIELIERQTGLGPKDLLEELL